VIFSGQLLLDLAEAGMLREDAYRIVQAHAMRSWETGEDFRTTVENDPEVRRWLPPNKLDVTFSAERHLRHVDRIFERVFDT
jgi:adenylosuccinate lyase